MLSHRYHSTYLPIVALGLFAMTSSTIALANSTDEQALSNENSAVDFEASESSVDELAPVGKFVADGTAVRKDDLGMIVTPPAGWEVLSNSAGLSLVMQQPKPQKVKAGDIVYQANLTVAALHQSSPIDETRAEELKADLKSRFASDPLAQDFQILEHKFVNYRGQNDGLLIYSSLGLRDIPVMQMHLLVSGSDKQFLLTYSDLAERFTAPDDSNYAAAWNTMMSLEVTGATPKRITLAEEWGPLGAGMLGVFLVVIFLRRRALNYDYSSAADVIDYDNFNSTTEQAFEGGAPLSILATLQGQWLVGNDTHLAIKAKKSSVADVSTTQQTSFLSEF